MTTHVDPPHELTGESEQIATAAITVLYALARPIRSCADPIVAEILDDCADRLAEILEDYVAI